MKTAKLTLIATTAIIITACSASKKSKTSTASATPSISATNTVTATDPAANTTSVNTFVFVKPANGIYPPGSEELTALQTKYPQLKEPTLEKLKIGHFLYTEGACIKCHKAQSIYKYDEMKWVDIINNMASKARMSDVEKDAVFNYVIAIKAAQPK